MVSVTLSLFALVAVLRFSIGAPDSLVGTYFLLPIALAGMEFGWRGGVFGAALSSAAIIAWAVSQDAALPPSEIVARCGFLALFGTWFGVLGARMSQAVTDRGVIADQMLYMEALTVHGMIRLDRSGVVTGWNRGASEILGYSEAEAQALSLTVIFGDDEAGSSFREMLDGALRHGLWDEERWVIAKDGRRLRAAISVTPLGSGRRSGFALVIGDLTAREAARHESSRMWELSFQLLATIRFDGYFQHLNPRWEELLGWTTEELLARPMSDFIHPEDVERTDVRLAQRAQGIVVSPEHEMRLRCRDGSYRSLLWNSIASLDDGLLYAAALDVTERRRQEAAIEVANKELEAFSYSVSHDLRAPLRAIDGYTQAILEDFGEELPAQAQSDFARVRAASQRMSLLIDEMLALSRVTRRELRSGSVDLSGLADEITGELRGQAGEREVEATIERGLHVAGDPELLRLVLHNLLENAWKFTAHTEGARVSLSTVARADGRATLAVRDNGAGFDMRYADKLFLPFERLHRQDEFPGTGVGLATVARVLRRHGGAIWAEGAPGEGASFFFDLQTAQEPHAQDHA